MLWLAGDIKEPTRSSQRAGHEVPGVVVWPLLLKWGLGWEMLGDVSYHEATLQSDGKHSVHCVHRISSLSNLTVWKHWRNEDWNFVISKHGALTIWMEFSVIPGRIQMERFIPVESFRKKSNTFPGISFFPLLPEFPKISVPFVNSYSARLFTVILLRKNA